MKVGFRLEGARGSGLILLVLIPTPALAMVLHAFD